MSAMDRGRMEDLVAAYLDRDLGPEDAEQLFREMRGNPEARRYLLLASHIDVALHDLGRARVRASRPPSTGRRWGGIAAAAVFLIAAAVAAVLFLSAPAAVGRIRTASPGVFIDRKEASVAAAPGSPLFAGDGLHVPAGGSVVVAGTEDATLTAGSRTSLRFPSPTEVGVETGTLSARVEKRAADAPPLLFRTPESEALVLGTIFNLTVTPEATRLDVAEGKVRLTRLSDRRTLEVSGGHYAVAASGVELKAIPVAVSPPGFIVAPGGSAEGDGSPENAWDLATALAHPAVVKPGDTIWLRAGTYPGVFRSVLRGTAEAPITVRAFGRERATVDGGIEAHGAWTTFRGFEITNTSPDRGPERPAGLGLFGRGHKAVNLVVHDTGNPGIGFREDVGDGGEVSGCILWGNGILDRDGRPVGSAVSAQNREGTRIIRETIAFRNYQTGLFVFAEQGFAEGFRLEGNVVFDHPRWGIVATGGENPIRSLHVVDNLTYSRRSQPDGDLVRFGLVPQAWNGAIVVQGNTFALGLADEAFHLYQWKDVQVAGNTIIGRKVLARWTPGAAGVRRWNENTYFTDGSGAFLLPDVRLGYSDWKQSTRFDEDSVLNPWAPGGTRVFVRPNPHEQGRAHVVVYNWDRKPSLLADLSRVLQDGDHYVVRDAQDYYGSPAARGRFDGKPVAIPIAQAGEFAVFVVERE